LRTIIGDSFREIEQKADGVHSCPAVVF